MHLESALKFKEHHFWVSGEFEVVVKEILPLFEVFTPISSLDIIIISAFSSLFKSHSLKSVKVFAYGSYGSTLSYILLG